MIILLILLIQLYYLLKVDRFNKSCLFIVFSLIVWNIGWLIILQFELSGSGISTYGSDETTYYSTMLQAYGSENWYNIAREDFNFTYVLYGTLILKTSFFAPSVFFVRLGNVLLLINMMMFLYLLLTRTFSIRSKIVYYGILIIGFNGIVTWTAIRNLKDIMFIYFLVLFIYLFLEWFIHKRWSILGIAGLGISWYVLSDIRQWFPYMALAAIILIILVELIKRRKFFLSFILVCSVTILSIPFFKYGLTTLLIYTVSFSVFSGGGGDITNFINTNIFSLPLSMGRFILGPGPIRGMFGTDSFLNHTTTGNILITLGGVAWWAIVPFFLLAITSIRNIKRMYLILFVLMFYWVMYSYAYSGSGDSRLRAVLYILCSIYTIPFLVDTFKKRMIPHYVIILFLIVSIGSYFSYVSLS